MGNDTEFGKVPPSGKALAEALELAEAIVTDLEMSRAELAKAVLKAIRLARLMNDFDMQAVMQYEAGGYPSTPDGIAPDVWRLLQRAGRVYLTKDTATKKTKEIAYTTSIESLELEVLNTQARLAAARDPDIAVGSPTPYQAIGGIAGNWTERNAIASQSATAVSRLSSRRAFVYQYATQVYYELKFSGIAEDVFSRRRQRVDSLVGSVIPGAVRQFDAVYTNLSSENPEDWSNAVHGCRRILSAVADAVYPADPKKPKLNRGGKEIKVGPDNYINRIVAFVENESASTRFFDVVGSHLEFLGNRLESIWKAASKGTHKHIIDRQEADRYVVYTYLLIGDILSLYKPPPQTPSASAVEGDDAEASRASSPEDEPQ